MFEWVVNTPLFQLNTFLSLSFISSILILLINQTYHFNFIIRSLNHLIRTFVNLSIGTTVLELELELVFELIL